MLSLVLLLGLISGSFLNTLIYRLPNTLSAPNALSLTKPLRSICPHCHHPLSAMELLPLISFLYQKGRCTHCQQRIAYHYPLVELAAALVSVLMVVCFGFSAQSICLLILCYALICLFVIDTQHMLLPDIITLPFIALGLIFNASSAALIPLTDALIGAAAGYLFLWSIYWLFKRLRNKEAMGYGDFKLSALLGAWFGWQALLPILITSSLLGIVFAVIFLRHRLSAPFPFGPFLIIAAGSWLFLIR